MSARLRVACVLSSLIAGGAERQMLLLLRHLDRERFDPRLAVLSADGPLRDEVPEDVPLASLDKRSRWDAPKLVLRLARLLRDTRPDVLLAKVDYANWIAAAADAAGRTHVPLVLGEETVQSDGLGLVRHARLRTLLLRAAYRRAAVVTAPSVGVEADLRDAIGVRARAFAVIPNMVDLNALAVAAATPVDVPFSGGGLPLLVTVGRLAVGKGHDDLIRAVALLDESEPCTLAIVGEGAEAPRLRALARELGVDRRVAFLGFLGNPFALMAQARVVVSPSHSESFGNVLIEAMAVGVPLVSTDLPIGPASVLRDGQNALLCRPRDPADLAAKVATLVRNPSLAHTLVERATEDVRAYDVSRVVPQYEAVLLAAAGRGGGE
jgi:glycosyltransferase involved in cell wall biosynthesis